MPVSRAYNLKRHGSGAFNGIFVATGWTETAFASERNEFIFTTGTTAVHGTAKRRVTAAEHTVNVFHNGGSGVCGIKDFFIMVSDNSL